MAELLKHPHFDRPPVVNEKHRNRSRNVINLRTARRHKVSQDFWNELADLRTWAIRNGKNPDLPYPELQRLRARHEAEKRAEASAPEMGEINRLIAQAHALFSQAFDLKQRVVSRYTEAGHG